MKKLLLLTITALFYIGCSSGAGAADVMKSSSDFEKTTKAQKAAANKML